MAAMAFLGFTSSHSGGHGGHDTAGHDMHGAGGHSLHAGHGVGQGHADAPVHGAGHSAGQTNNAHAAQHDMTAGIHTHSPHVHGDGWKSHLWTWFSPRVLFNFLVGFGATGMITERLVGPLLALPVAILGGIGFELLVVRPIFNSLFKFGSEPAQTLEAAIMGEGKA